MDREFLDLYNRELLLLQEQAGEFAEEYPGIAERLGGLVAERTDPMIAGLLEGAAFLAARVQLKLKHEFPEFTSNLLEQLIPNYLAPTPSMMLAKVLRRHHDVEVLGSLFRAHAPSIWRPCDTGEFDYQIVEGCKFPRYLGSIRQLLKRLSGDVIYACKARLPSYGVALLKRLLGGKRVVLDIDDLVRMHVTSPAKKSQSSFEVPSAIYVIRGDDLRRSGATSLPEALRGVPGLDVAVHYQTAKRAGERVLRHRAR
jgi:type VI secretion system protein ImpG